MNTPANTNLVQQTVHSRFLVRCRFLSLLFLVHCFAIAKAPALDLSNAIVVAPPNLSTPEKKAVAMLVEEVEKRTQIRWQTSSAWPDSKTPVIALGQATA